MPSKILGRAPIEAGPAWDKNGVINPLWERWFNGDTTETLRLVDAFDSLSGIPLSINSQGVSKESLVSAILELGQSLQRPNPPPQDSINALQSSTNVRLGAVYDSISGLQLSQRPTKKTNLQILVYTQAAYRLAYVAGLGSDPVFIFVSDYSHWIFWDGAAAQFADDGNNFTAEFENDPLGAWWHVCDGSTVDYLNVDGTVTPITLVDLVSTTAKAAYIKAGSPNSGPNAAVAPAFTGNSVTAAGTVTSAFAGTLITFTTGLFVAVSGLVAALVSPTSVTPAGSILSAFTGSPVPVTGTVDATGEPRNLVRRPFYRR